MSPVRPAAIAALATIVALVLAPLARAADGEVDPGFHGDGRLVFHSIPGAHFAGYALAEAPDGRVVSAGAMAIGTGQSASWTGFGRTEVAAIVAVAVNKLPNVAVTVREGARALSRDLAEMAHMYRFGPWKTLRHVTLPQLAPFFLASARTGLSLVWKIVLVVELLGRSNGVGFQLGTYFQLFDVSMILAYALAFIVVVQLIEFGILQPIAARVNRWRR